ncbi:hypothetical protein ACP6PM_36115 [Dapis sp. BLCC M229]
MLYPIGCGVWGVWGVSGVWGVWRVWGVWVVWGVSGVWGVWGVCMQRPYNIRIININWAIFSKKVISTCVNFLITEVRPKYSNAFGNWYNWGRIH